MWKCEQSITVSASKAVVWAVWSDVEKWAEWDATIIEAALLGACEIGVEGRMKMANDTLVSFTISELIPEERLVLQTNLFGARLLVIHEVMEEDQARKVCHRIEISGILGWFWGLIIGRRMEKSLPSVMESLGRYIAEKAEKMPQSVSTVAVDSSTVVQADGVEKEEKVTELPANNVAVETRAEVPAEVPNVLQENKETNQQPIEQGLQKGKQLPYSGTKLKVRF